MNRPSVGSYLSTGKRKARSKKKKGTISANIAATKYEIGMVTCKSMSSTNISDNSTCTAIWLFEIQPNSRTVATDIDLLLRGFKSAGVFFFVKGQRAE